MGEEILLIFGVSVYFYLSITNVSVERKEDLCDTKKAMLSSICRMK